MIKNSGLTIFKWAWSPLGHGMVQVLIRRGEASFGPLAPDEVVAQFEQGVILAGDEGWYEGLEGWLPVPELVRRLAPMAARSTSSAETKAGESIGAATPGQVVRLRALGVSGRATDKLKREEAAALIAKTEESAPAGRALLSKMERMGLPIEPGITIAVARRRLESASLHHYLAILGIRGIPYATPITAAEAEELAEAGPPTDRQLQRAAEIGLRPPPNIGQRSLDRLIEETAAAEANMLEEFFGIATRSSACSGITRQQVRDVLWYLNRNFPGWREQDGVRRFFYFVAKFYPHLSGAAPTTRPPD